MDTVTQKDSLYSRFVDWRILSFEFGGTLFPESIEEKAEKSGDLRSICFRVSPGIIDELDNVCNVLGVSKSVLLRMMLADGLFEAKEKISSMFSRLNAEDLEGKAKAQRKAKEAKVENKEGAA
jgi:hypothetical protein